MYDPTQFDPSAVYGPQSPALAYSAYAPQQTTANPMVQQLNPQQPTPQQKLAMALMQQNGQQQPTQGQNPQGQTSPWASIAQMGQMFMGMGAK